MDTALESSSNGRASRSGTGNTARRAGWGIAVLVNLALLWVANSILDWDVLPWLTDEFGEALPAINVSLWIAVIVNLLRLAYSPTWFVGVTEIISLASSLRATVVMWRVFPLDFTNYWSGWELVVRALLVVAIVGTITGILTQVVKLLRGAAT